MQYHLLVLIDGEDYDFVHKTRERADAHAAWLKKGGRCSEPEILTQAEWSKLA